MSCSPRIPLTLSTTSPRFGYKKEASFWILVDEECKKNTTTSDGRSCTISTECLMRVDLKYHPRVRRVKAPSPSPNSCDMVCRMRILTSRPKFNSRSFAGIFSAGAGIRTRAVGLPRPENGTWKAKILTRLDYTCSAPPYLCSILNP